MMEKWTCLTCEEDSTAFNECGYPLNAKEFVGDGYQCEECQYDKRSVKK